MIAPRVPQVWFGFVNAYALALKEVLKMNIPERRCSSHVLAGQLPFASACLQHMAG
jgi:hypothetical protein